MSHHWQQVQHRPQRSSPESLTFIFCESFYEVFSLQQEGFNRLARALELWKARDQREQETQNRREAL